jgi:hypothetical protein
MSLITCPECHQQKSEYAAICPHCGFQKTPLRVTVVDLDIGFGNLVGLLVKVVLAAIPAIIILVVAAALIASFIGAMK